MKFETWPTWLASQRHRLKAETLKITSSRMMDAGNTVTRVVGTRRVYTGLLVFNEKTRPAFADFQEAHIGKRPFWLPTADGKGRELVCFFGEQIVRETKLQPPNATFKIEVVLQVLPTPPDGHG